MKKTIRMEKIGYSNNKQQPIYQYKRTHDAKYVSNCSLIKE